MDDLIVGVVVASDYGGGRCWAEIGFGEGGVDGG